MKIGIYGATGFTGKLVTTALVSKGFCPMIAGRDSQRLQALAEEVPGVSGFAVLDASDPSQVQALFDSCDGVINCVGPFNLLGYPILDCAARSGKFTLDVSGEQGFIKASFEKYDSIARESGSSLLHSFSFESCLADLLAAEICEAGQRYEDISSFYHFDHARPSPGTHLTMQLARHFGTYIHRNGKLCPAAPLSEARDVAFEGSSELKKALFMPYPEVLFFPRTYSTARAGSYLLTTEEEAAMMLSAESPPPRPIEEILERHARRRFHPPTPAERKEQGFVLYVKAEQEGRSRYTGISGFDMYGLTSAIVAEAVSEIQRLKRVPCGVVMPHQILKAGPLLAGIGAEYGIKTVR